MHILQVHGWWKVDQPGGVITMMKTLAAALEARGHRVTVLAGDWNARDIEEDEEGGRPFYRLRLPAPPRRAWHLKGWLGWLRDLPRAVRRLRRFAEERGIDVVHLHWPRPYFFAFRLLRMRRGPPYIVTLHLTDVTSFAELPRSHRHLVKSVVDHAAARTAVSSWLAAEGERCLCPGHSVGVVYNGIDPEDVAEAPEAELEPYRLRLPERYFAMLANLHPYKGHDVALRAWADVVAAEPTLHLAIMGTGGIERELRDLTDSLGLGGTVHFLGYVPRPVALALAAKASGLLAPSRSEGFGYMLIEAGLLDVPIVASSIEPFTEYLQDDETALLVPVEDHAALAKACLRIAADPQLGRRLAAGMRARVERDFLASVMAERYEFLYRNALEHAGRPT